jgi:hypothetical protein
MGLIVNVEKIEKIYTHKARQSFYVRYNEGKPEERIFFGLIRLEKEQKPYWRHSYDDNYDTREDLVSSNSDKYYINDEALFEYSVWEKPHLYIVMSHAKDVTIYFDSYEELQEKLDEIMNQSNGNLVIINK